MCTMSEVVEVESTNSAVGGAANQSETSAGMNISGPDMTEQNLLVKETSETSQPQEGEGRDKTEENKVNSGSQERKKNSENVMLAEEVLFQCKEALTYLKEQKEWDNGSVLDKVKSISKMYWNHRDMRSSIGDYLAELDYSGTTV